MNSDYQCDHCHAAVPVRPVQFVGVIGLLLAVIRMPFGGLLCADCTRKVFHKTLLMNLTIGMLWVLSFLLIPIIVIQNLLQYRRVMEEFSRMRPAAPRRIESAGPPTKGAPPDGRRPQAQSVPATRNTRPPSAAPRAGGAVPPPVIAPQRAPDPDPDTPLPAGPQETLAVSSSGRGTPSLGSRHLSGLDIIVALLCIFLVPLTFAVLLGLMGRGGEEKAAQNEFLRTWGLLIDLVGIGLVVLLVRSIIRAKARANVHPDLLGILLDPGCIFDAGDAHVAVLGVRHGPVVRILVLAQNLFDGDSVLGLYTTNNTPCLQFLALPASAVTLACYDVPANAFRRGDCFEAQLYPKATGAKGPRIRSVARPAATTRGREMLLMGAMLLAGHLHVSINAGRGGRPQQAIHVMDSTSILRIPLCGQVPPPNADDLPYDAQCGFQAVTEILWSPGSKRSLEEITGRLADAITQIYEPAPESGCA